jgi:hypothetical protein
LGIKQVIPVLMFLSAGYLFYVMSISFKVYDDCLLRRSILKTKTIYFNDIQCIKLEKEVFISVGIYSADDMIQINHKTRKYKQLIRFIFDEYKEITPDKIDVKVLELLKNT